MKPIDTDFGEGVPGSGEGVPEGVSYYLLFKEWTLRLLWTTTLPWIQHSSELGFFAFGVLSCGLALVVLLGV